MTELKTLEALAAECERLRDLCTGGIMIHPSQVLEAIKPFIAARPEPTESRAEQYGTPINQYDRPEPTELERRLRVVVSRIEKSWQVSSTDDVTTLLQAADALAHVPTMAAHIVRTEAKVDEYEAAMQRVGRALADQTERAIQHGDRANAAEATMQRVARKLTLLAGSNAVTSTGVGKTLHNLARMLRGGHE